MKPLSKKQNEFDCLSSLSHNAEIDWEELPSAFAFVSANYSEDSMILFFFFCERQIALYCVLRDLKQIEFSLSFGIPESSNCMYFHVIEFCFIIINVHYSIELEHRSADFSDFDWIEIL